MKHTSVKLETPCEFINITPVNPLISKCQIKVCYVSDEPNRNRSVITKETAKKMANSLPGCPIVGFYNEAKEDFEEHNRIIDISNGEFKIKDTTKPYGFVDLNAKVWFQKFLDDNAYEREYLMTEGYIWTGQYPESQRILEQGNNQSMELDEKYLDATWTKDNNGKYQFFIINEAIISKLCILGEDAEPCFEGAQITKVEFSFEDGFKTRLFSMMNELKDLLKEGGFGEMYTQYAVEIGDSLWTAIYSYIQDNYPDANREYCSIYRIEGIYEEKGQKFVVLQHREELKYYRLNFDLSEGEGFAPGETLLEVTKSYVPAETAQFATDAVEQFESEYAQNKKAELDKNDEVINDNSDNVIEGNDSGIEFSAENSEENDTDTTPAVEEPVAPTYSLEEIPEYVALQEAHNELQNTYAALMQEVEELRNNNAALENQLQPLVAFKKASEKKEKEAMIASFYMLTDDDKKDVIENIDTYSLEDIEAKLAIICVRNRVSFNENDSTTTENIPTVFHLENNEDDSTPAWVKAAIAVSEKKI